MIAFSFRSPLKTKKPLKVASSFCKLTESDVRDAEVRSKYF